MPGQAASLRAIFAQTVPLRGMIEAAFSRGRVHQTPDGTCAALTAGDFVILGGEPELPAGAALLHAALSGSACDQPLVYAPGRWKDIMTKMGYRYAVSRRWSFDHDVQPEDAHLQAILQGMPENAAFQPIEGNRLIMQCFCTPWMHDFVSQFSSCEDYRANAVGVLLKVDGAPVAGASAYLSYEGGIELQVETRPDSRGRGYATFAAAKVILMAHERGWIATWDAANAASARIAEKLGYQPTGAYEICEVFLDE